MTTPDRPLQPQDQAPEISPQQPDFTDHAIRQTSNQGAHGGSSLGDGAPPTANAGEAPGAASHDTVSTDKPRNYGGGYGGQPRPRSG